MSRTESDPVPKDAVPIERFCWPTDRSLHCPAVTSPATVTKFVDVVESRRSVRDLCPPSLGVVAKWLAFSTRPRFEKNADHGRTRRPSPSSGALHAVEPILVHRRVGAFRYCYREHRLDHLVPTTYEKVDAFLNATRALVPNANGLAIAFVCDRALVEAHYSFCESLYLRDSGALLATLHFTATAYGLAFCPLGILGNQIAAAFDPDRLVGVGAAVVGRTFQ